MYYACSHTSQVSSGLSPRALGVLVLPVFSISSVPSAFFTSQVQPEPKLARAACEKMFFIVIYQRLSGQIRSQRIFAVRQRGEVKGHVGSPWRGVGYNLATPAGAEKNYAV